MPSRPTFRSVLVAAALAAVASHGAQAQSCDDWVVVPNCTTCPGVFDRWIAVGPTTNTCEDAYFTIRGVAPNGDECTDPPTLPVVVVAREAYPDCRWTVLIKSSNDFTSYTVQVRQADVDFKSLRVVNDGSPAHDVTLYLSGFDPVSEMEVPLGEIEELGEILRDNEGFTLDADVTLIGQNFDTDTKSIGELGCTVLQELTIKGNLGFATVDDVASILISDYIQSLTIQRVDDDLPGDLLGELAVQGDNGAGVSIVSLTVQGRVGLNDPTPNSHEEDAGRIATDDAIALLSVGEVADSSVIEVGVDGSEPIGLLDVTTAAYTGATGDFRGELIASTVDNGASMHQISVVGDFYGEMTFSDAITDHDDDTPVILIDGALKSGSRITVPEDGLVGQIIPNRANTGAAWQSGAEVVVGDPETGIHLTETIYKVPASDIGFGAVGRAEYRLHRESCDPAETYSQTEPIERLPAELYIPGELILDPITLEWECVRSPDPIFLQFYGPISILDDDPAVRIRFWTGSAWLNMSSDFDFEEEPDGELKRLKIYPTDEWVSGSYEITREPQALHSRHVEDDGEFPAGITSFIYYVDVTVESCGSEMLAGFDFNADSAVTESGDVPAWFVGPVDLNMDSVADAQDVPTLQAAAALFAQVGAPIYFPGPYLYDEYEE